MEDSFIPIVCPEMRRLTLSQKGLVNKYLEKENTLFYYYKIDKKKFR